MAINNRYDFVILFDVENGNPNGDPDAGNSPRIDVESGYGFVTDVCMKRKIRNYVEMVKDGEKGYNILIKNDKSLNSKFIAVYDELDLEKPKKDKNGKTKKIPESEEKARDYMCKNYYDVRMFGAVMSTGDCSCGSVRGPVQINFAKSVSQINVQDITITRQARTTEEKQESGNTTEFGKKSFVPYALYRAEGYVSAALANKVTDLSEEDLDLLWEAITNMFEHEHSAARGKMCVRKLIVFKHENVLGNCPSHILFDKVVVNEKNPVPRKYNDYEIIIDKSMPQGVEIIEKI